MTKIEMKKVKCAKCGVESDQFVVYSVNFLLGPKEQNEELVRHKQKCPNCGYEATNIAVLENRD